MSIAPAKNICEPSNGSRNGSVCEFCNWLKHLETHETEWKNTKDFGDIAAEMAIPVEAMK